MEIGTEVAALLSADSEEIRFLGYGIHQGGFPPRIDLENGRTVYGSQCWWMEKSKFPEWRGDRKLVHVYPEGDRIPDEKKDI